MLTKKQICAITIVLISTLIVGVYAGTRISPVINASWFLASGDEFQLSWNPAPPSSMSKQVAYIYGVRMQNMQNQSFTVFINFSITADLNLPSNCLTLGESVGTTTQFNDMTPWLTGWGTQELKAGALQTFMAPGADVTVYFRINLQAIAPTTTYSTYVWLEYAGP